MFKFNKKYQMQLHRDNINKFIEITDKMCVEGFDIGMKENLNKNWCVVYIAQSSTGITCRTWNDIEEWDNLKYKDYEVVTWDEFLKMTNESTRKFKVGDKVYMFGSNTIYQIKSIENNSNKIYLDGGSYFSIDNVVVDDINILLATEENYQILCQLFPHINFEKPSKILTGNELCEELLNNWEYVPCYVSQKSEKDALRKSSYPVLIYRQFGKEFVDTENKRWIYVVPVDLKTNEPLPASEIE